MGEMEMVVLVPVQEGVGHWQGVQQAAYQE